MKLFTKDISEGFIAEIEKLPMTKRGMVGLFDGSGEPKFVYKRLIPEELLALGARICWDGEKFIQA